MFEVIVVKAASLESCMLNVDSHASELKPLVRRPERIRSIPVDERGNYFT